MAVLISGIVHQKVFCRPRGCLTALGKPLPDGRGSVTGTPVSHGLPSRDRQGADPSIEIPKAVKHPARGATQGTHSSRRVRASPPTFDRDTPVEQFSPRGLSRAQRLTEKLGKNSKEAARRGARKNAKKNWQWMQFEV
jgi:hypothetical protein